MKTYLIKPGIRQTIAKVGETDVAVSFDGREWKTAYPSGHPQLLVTAPGGQQMPVTVEDNAGMIEGRVPEELLSAPGAYVYQFVWTQGATQQAANRCDVIITGSELSKTWETRRHSPEWAEKIFLAAEVIEGAMDGTMEARNAAQDAADDATSSKEAAAASAESAAASAESAAEDAEAVAGKLEEVVNAGDAKLAAIELKGQTTLESIPEDYTALDYQVKGMSSKTENLFDTSLLDDAEGITRGQDGYWVGAASAFSAAFSGGVEGVTFEAGKQYYISLIAYTEANASEEHVNGLQISFYSGETRIGRRSITNDVTTPNFFELTSTAGNDVTKLTIAVSNVPSNIWHVKDIMLIASAVPVAYIPHETAKDVIARKNAENGVYAENVTKLLVDGGYINLQSATVGDTVTLTPVPNANIRYAIINVQAGDAFVLTTKGAAAARPYAFVDEEDKITEISTGFLTTTNLMIVAPADGKLIVNSIKTDAYSIFKLENAKMAEKLLDAYYIEKDRKAHKWRGKKIVTFGDSRTWYDKKAYTENTKSELIGSVCVGYQEQMRNLMMADVINQGISGDTSADICERILAFDFTGYDAVLLEGGVNDFVKSSSVTIGEIQPIGGTFDATTVYGAWQSAIEYILTTYPGVQIYMTIPAIAWIHQADDVFPYSIAKIKGEIADLYHLPCIDLYKNGGINVLNRDNWYCDNASTTYWRLHFNDAGNALLGAKIAEFMIAN